MTAADLRAKIEFEIADRWDSKNPHGVDLRSCLIEPELRDYHDAAKVGCSKKLWLVLEEHPEKHEGYSIVYDESEDTFGLAVKSQDGKSTCIGLYGTFMETLKGM